MTYLKKLFPFGAVTAVAVLILGLGSCGLLEPDDEEEDKDVRSPTITLKGDNPDTTNVGTSYDDPGCTADDPEDGDITSSVTVDYGSLDTGEAEEGTYTITYSVSDKAGNSDDATRKVVVVDTETTTNTTITTASLGSCPVTFDDTNVVYTIPSGLNITSNCSVTFGARTEFVVKGKIGISDGGTLTILEGAKLAFDDNAYISIGGNGNGTLKALGTEEDSIQFTNLTSGTRWGSGTSATYSGGLWFNDAATAACSLVYCSIDSATSGIYVEKASVTVSNCRIASHQYYGCFFADEASPVDSAHFIENAITDNGECGIHIYANYLGALSGTGSVADNTKGGIFIKSDKIESDAVWKPYDAAYVVEGHIAVGSESGATLTIRPGCVFQLKDNAYFSVGVSNNTGAIVADGTEEDSIRFTNYTGGTKWGSGTSANYSGGIWIDDAATSNCSFTYCTIDSATSGIYIRNASATISHCHIEGNEWFGIFCDDGGSPGDSAGFVDNVINGNGDYGVRILAGFAGALSGTGSFSGNTNGAILITGNAVENDAVWKPHDAAYVVESHVAIGSESGATLTIRPGCVFQLKDNAYFSIGGSDKTGTIVADGTEEDSIRFTNYTSGTKWGSGTSANYSGGIWIDDEATANCSFTYCTIDSATSGIYISNASATISHCHIEGNEWFGIFCADEGTPTDSAGFVDNVITGNGDFGVALDANFVGALSGTGSFDGNTDGGILVKADAVETDAIWKKHDVPYVVDGHVAIKAPSGVTVTIRPGAAFLLKDNAYLSVGVNNEGTLIAEGTESDSISFADYSSGTNWGSGTSATYSGGIWIDDMATATTSVKYCTITKATTGIWVNTVDATVKNCSITDCQYYGIYLNDCPATNIADNAFSGNGSGDTGTN
ncbi:MAG: right-handed parallel beta-helix repeat-containing protein [Chitinispirillaceae bacterium]|nr:right-handed parallel beta-helix repeat-containing protein [Chitinispirillaceae bacterium]